MSEEIPLFYLSKSNYGGMSTIKTYSTFCQNHATEQPIDAWLIPNTFKYSMLTKVVTAYLDGMEFIVKIQPFSNFPRGKWRSMKLFLM